MICLASNRRIAATPWRTVRARLDAFAGEGAMLVDSTEPAVIVFDLGQALVENGSLRESGPSNAARFNVEAMRDGYLSLYLGLEGRA